MILVLVLMVMGVYVESIKDLVCFEFNEWYDIEEEYGLVMVYCICVCEIEVGVKLKIFCLGKLWNMIDVCVEIEYSNLDDWDYEVKLLVYWLDKEGCFIDGVEVEEDFNEDERYEIMMNMFLMFCYGFEVVCILDFEICW